MKKLETRIKSHDKDIERMCNAHYQGFVDCIHELLQVRPQAQRLKREMSSINSDLIKSSDNVLRKADELIRYRRILVNSEEAIENLSSCLPVLEMYQKLVTQMDGSKYYPALKTLEQLENNYLPLVSKYRFAQTMCAKIPKFRDDIKRASEKDLMDFLENVRRLSGKIGEVAMKTSARQQNFGNVDFHESTDGSLLFNDMKSTSCQPNQPMIHTNSSNNLIVNSASSHSINSSTNSSPAHANVTGAISKNSRGNSVGSSASGGSATSNHINNPPVGRKKRRAPPPPNPFTGEIEDHPSPDQNSESSDTISGTGAVNPTSTNMMDGGSSSPSAAEEMSATDLIDFSPVYRCHHIFTCLGSREYFEEDYRNQRKQQARLALQSPINMHESIEGYKNYFCGIMGFFVIEDHILSTAPGLVTKSYLDDLWENALTSLLASLRTHSSYCTEEILMLQIKRSIMLFSYTMKSHGFNVNPLMNLLLEIRDQYNEILMKRWVLIFRQIFEADNYHPIQVNHMSEYNEVISEFPYVDPEYLQVSSCNSSSEPKVEFPKKFPFSSFVPKVYSEVKKFIICCLQFSQDLNSSQTEIEDMVRKSTNILLTRTLGGCLSSLIKKPSLGLLQLIQITINTNYLENACGHLEEYINKIINSSQILGIGSTGSLSGTTINMSSPVVTSATDTTTSHLARLQGKSMFKDTRADAESQIYLQLNQKIDEFFELASYDWMLIESRGVASSYVSDLIAFLKSTFEAFTNLPLKVAQTACHSGCKHMASSLMNFLMDEEVKCVSPGALEQFNLDLIQCELFAASEPVKGFEDGSLQMCFTELRQLIDLFTSWDWSTYFADYGKQDSKFLRVNPQSALNLLEKIKEADKKKNLFASLKKNERDKKKLIDTVSKQLRQLVINNNSM